MRLALMAPAAPLPSPDLPIPYPGLDIFAQVSKAPSKPGLLILWPSPQGVAPVPCGCRETVALRVAPGDHQLAPCHQHITNSISADRRHKCLGQFYHIY